MVTSRAWDWVQLGKSGKLAWLRAVGDVPAKEPGIAGAIRFGLVRV